MNWPLLQNSLLVATLTALFTLVLGVLAAVWAAGLETRWRNAFLGVAIATLALPPFLVTNCWLDLLGDTGLLRQWLPGLPTLIYSLGGTVWILTLMLWPIALFAALSAWRRLEAAQFECEPSMTGWALLRWLLLPAARGELVLAAVITFVLALNNFAVPAILQTKVLPDEMWVRFNTQFDAAGALKLSVPLVLAPLLLLWAARKGVRWPRWQGTVSPRVVKRQVGKTWSGTGGFVAVSLVILSLLLPLAQIGITKRTWTELPGAIEAGTGAIWTSFWFAALTATVVVALACALPAGNSRFTALMARLSWLLFLIPGVLMGIAMIKVFNRPPFIAFYQSAGIVILALIIRYFTLGWTAARHALHSVDADLTDAARLEGATRAQMLRLVLWPQIAPQLAAAWYVVYLLCLWDVEAIVLIVPPGGETLALRIFNLLHYGHAAQVNALCLTLLGVALLPLLLWTFIGWGKKSSKRQPPSSREIPTSKLSIPLARSLVGASNLKFLWNLVLGIWCFTFSGCSPGNDPNEAPLSSRFFSRARVIGGRGVGVGEFNKPRSITVDHQDNVYSVDMTGRVQKFSPAGEFLLSWQMPQTELGKPKGMGCDRAGNVIVIEPHYQRINQFTTDGLLLSQWGCKGTNEGCFNLPRGVAVTSRGDYLISEYMGGERVQRFGVRWVTNAVNQAQTSEHPQEKTNNLQIPQYASEVRLLQVIGRPGTDEGEFNRAEGVCVDAQDRLYVADSCNHRIQIFASDGQFLRAFGKPGTRLGEMSYPYDVAVDATGRIYVCEFGNSRIQIFDANCQPLEIVGGAGAQPGQLNNPWGLALDSHGNLYVADALNHRLQKFIRSQSVVSSPSSVAPAILSTAVPATDY